MGVVKEGCGGPQSPEASGEIGFHSGYTGNPLKGGSSAWLLPGANRRRVNKSARDAMGWAGAARGPGFRACALENRSGMGEHQAHPVLLCVGAGALSETGQAQGGRSSFWDLLGQDAVRPARQWRRSGLGEGTELGCSAEGVCTDRCGQAGSLGRVWRADDVVLADGHRAGGRGLREIPRPTLLDSQPGPSHCWGSLADPRHLWGCSQASVCLWGR